MLLLNLAVQNLYGELSSASVFFQNETLIRKGVTISPWRKKNKTYDKELNLTKAPEVNSAGRKEVF